jgi:hypothetical protein
MREPPVTGVADRCIGLRPGVRLGFPKRSRDQHAERLVPTPITPLAPIAEEEVLAVFPVRII